MSLKLLAANEVSTRIDRSRICVVTQNVYCDSAIQISCSHTQYSNVHDIILKAGSVEISSGAHAEDGGACNQLKLATSAGPTDVCRIFIRALS